MDVKSNMKGKKTKICFLSTGAYPLFNSNSTAVHGGAEIQLSLIAKELAKDKRFHVDFIVGDFGQKAKEIYNNVHLHKTFNPQATDSFFTKLWQAIKYFRLFIKLSPDILFTSAANSAIGLVGFYCKLFRKKHIHRTASLMDVNKEYILQNGFIGKLYKYGLEHAGIILVQSKEQKKHLFDNHSSESVIFKNLFVFSAANNKIDSKYILWVSRLDFMKNPYLFLQMSKQFPAEKFTMICPPKSAGKNEEWIKLQKEAESISNLTFIEKVPFNEIQSYFNEAKVFVNTSDFEGYPNTFIQAGIGKTPILSYKVNPDNFLNEYDCGYCCKGDFDIMVKTLDKLVSDKEDWQNKSRNVFEYVRKNHDIEKGIIKLDEIISNHIK